MQAAALLWKAALSPEDGSTIMKLYQALKVKNRLTTEISSLKAQIKEQNSRRVLQPFDYDTRILLDQLRKRIDELTRIKGAIGKANGAIYEQIFRLAEFKGMISFLREVPTKHGKFVESPSFTSSIEVEYQAQLRQAELDRVITDLESQVNRLQDELDRFNNECQIDVELN